MRNGAVKEVNNLCSISAASAVIASVSNSSFGRVDPAAFTEGGRGVFRPVHRWLRSACGDRSLRGRISGSSGDTWAGNDAWNPTLLDYIITSIYYIIFRHVVSGHAGSPLTTGCRRSGYSRQAGPTRITSQSRNDDSGRRRRDWLYAVFGTRRVSVGQRE